MEVKEKIEAFEPMSITIGPQGEMLTLPAISVWTLATMLKETFLDNYELIPGIPTVGSQNPPPYFRLKED